MQSLVDAKYLAEGRDPYMLQYVLQQRGMLSTTGYKVLQGQQAAGLIPCYRVLYGDLDKLDYDVEQYSDLQSLLPELEPNVFLHYVNGIFSVIMNMRNIGFLHISNLETTIDKIFIDRNNNTVHMIYLPIADAYLEFTNKNHTQVLKASLLRAISENKHLQTELVRPLFELLKEPATTVDQLQGALAGLEPLPQPAHVAVGTQTGTIVMNQTGDIGSGSLSSGNLTQPASEKNLQQPDPEPEPDVPAKKKKKGLFGPKKVQPLPPETVNAGGTEVLMLFVPTISLKGPGKEEYLVNKQEFVIGRDSEDCTIESTAISRKHCKITHSDQRNYLTDLGSANGTYLNGSKLEPDKPRPINEGDKIKLGNKGYTVMNV